MRTTCPPRRRWIVSGRASRPPSSLHPSSQPSPSREPTSKRLRWCAGASYDPAQTSRLRQASDAAGRERSSCGPACWPGCDPAPLPDMMLATEPDRVACRADQARDSDRPAPRRWQANHGPAVCPGHHALDKSTRQIVFMHAVRNEDDGPARLEAVVHGAVKPLPDVLSHNLRSCIRHSPERIIDD